MRLEYETERGGPGYIFFVDRLVPFSAVDRDGSCLGECELPDHGLDFGRELCKGNGLIAGLGGRRRGVGAHDGKGVCLEACCWRNSVFCNWERRLFITWQVGSCLTMKVGDLFSIFLDIHFLLKPLCLCGLGSSWLYLGISVASHHNETVQLDMMSSEALASLLDL